MPSSAAERPTILIVDDRDDLAQFCERFLLDAFAFVHVQSGGDALDRLDAGEFAGALLDRDFSQIATERLLGPADDVRNEGLTILREIRARHAHLPVVMVTGLRELAAALIATDYHADFLAWEDVIHDSTVLRARLMRAVESSRGESGETCAAFRGAGVVAQSQAMRRMLAAAGLALPGQAPILLLGETGTGKDTLAYAIHALSGDPLRPFVAVNVAALNPSLIESELFGHARGAFTGADRSTVGKIRHADGGTLFLNEVGELSTELQAKLLTVLERREVVPVGEVRSFRADFRLITATSRDLGGLVRTGRFRKDLFYRIAWHTIDIPPLRNRREDIPELAGIFLQSSTASRDGLVYGIAKEAVEYLSDLPWPGNVRQLRGVIEAASARALSMLTIADVRGIVRRQEELGAATEDAPLVVPAPEDRWGIRAIDTQAPGHGLREAAERLIFDAVTYRELTGAYFAFLMRQHAGRLAEIARAAGIAKATAYEWRDRYAGLESAAMVDPGVRQEP